MSFAAENHIDSCKRCNSCQIINVENALDYHEQIERLQAELKERKNVISQMDKNYSANLSRYETDAAKGQEEYAKLKYRHEALLEAFKTQQRINNTLEDKLLIVVSDMTKRYEDLEIKCKTLTSNLETANAKIAELTARSFDDEVLETPENANKSAPVSLGFGGGVFPMYHSSPDLCGMTQRHRQRNTVPSKKQTYSPFGIQTFPPTLMCDTSSFSESLTPRRVRDSDGGEEDDEIGNPHEVDEGRSLSNPPPVSSSPVVVHNQEETSVDLQTHRFGIDKRIGAVFTV